MELFKIIYRGLKLPNEANLPTLLAIGNGEIGYRGTVPELSDGSGVFLAGFYDGLPRPEMDPSTFSLFLRSWSHMNLVDGYHLEAALVNCPDPLDGCFEADGERFVLDESRAETVVRSLDLHTGEVRFDLPLTSPSGKRARLIRRRFASIEHPQCLFEQCTFTAENFAGELRYHAGFDVARDNGNISGIYMDMGKHVKPARYRLYDVLDETAEHLRIRGRVYGTIADFRSRVSRSSWRVKLCESVTLERVVTFACGLLHDASEGAVRAVSTTGYAQALADNRLAWDRLWRTSDLQIDGDERAQLGIRHSLYQLLIAAPRATDRVSVAAKGLSGEGYRGMLFWDTDIHMLPFFLHTQPQIALNLMRFRCRTLDGARRKAQRLGFVGASYPWETGVSGEEECESFLKLITNQVHITADVVHSIAQVAKNLGEDALPDADEVYLETARFWLSKGRLIDNRLTVPLASGPDELHLDCDNNAYVLYLAAENLLLAKHAVEKRRENGTWSELRARLGVTDAEEAALLGYEGEVCCHRSAEGVVEQCDGFFKLEDRIVYEDDENTVPEDTQTVKQADVIMLLYLLPKLVSREELLANWNYYEPRTTHTSSLSFGVHGMIAARLGLDDKAAYYLNRSLGIDLYSDGAACSEGAHLAADGMSWSAIVNGMAGVELTDDGISVHPRLPRSWRSVCFRLMAGGRTLRVKATQDGAEVAYEQGEAPLHVTLPSGEFDLKAGESAC